MPPQQETVPSAANLHVWSSPTAISRSWPGGMVLSPNPSLPQHEMDPSLLDAHTWLELAEISATVPVGSPRTIEDEVAPQHATLPSDLMPQWAFAATWVNVPAGAPFCPLPPVPHQLSVPSIRKP